MLRGEQGRYAGGTREDGRRSGLGCAGNCSCGRIVLCRFRASGNTRLVSEGYDAMSPLVTALICFGAFVLIGLIAKIAIGMWMKRQ
jgi:hypothetical protein